MTYFNRNKPLRQMTILALLVLCSSAMADSAGHQHGAMPMNMDEAGGHHPDPALAAAEVRVTGVIKAILLNTRQLKIQHEPIAAWNMGGMQMKFQLDPGIDISSLKAGQTIRFRLRQPGIGRFLITEINE